ncbi:MAG: hypothetical protein GY856_28250, partial [bacterium]|nr:hypothetical protein [bacterium]
DLADPTTVRRVLGECRAPFLIGVRHHSAVMARAMPELLSAFRADLLLLELPAEFQPWLKWLAHTGTTAPVALAGARGRPSKISFYPFADFSPELAAVRWAEAHGVEIVACDLPISAWTESADLDDDSDPHDAGAGLTALLHKRLHVPDNQSLWDRIVEGPAPGSTPEQIRLAGLLFGWLMRKECASIPMEDQKREAWMRSCIAAHKDRRCAAVVGAFHAPALSPDPLLPGETPPDVDKGAADRPRGKADSDTVACSLIPYDFSLLDERSGYPAGIRDPSWQQGVFESCTPGEQTRFLGRCITAICREMRRLGFQASSADAVEIMRLCRDLARLRSLAAPGRRELMESLRSTLARGEVMGQGRAVARAMETVLVGNRTGGPPPGLPRCGLESDLTASLEKLKLPGPGERLDKPKTMRLDPLRSPLDRARLVFLNRLAILEIPYGAPVRGDRAGETLTEAWDVRWDERCAAMAAHAALGGVTIAQASEGRLLRRERELEKTDGLNPAAL